MKHASTFPLKARLRVVGNAAALFAIGAAIGGVVGWMISWQKGMASFKHVLVSPGIQRGERLENWEKFPTMEIPESRSHAYLSATEMGQLEEVFAKTPLPPGALIGKSQLTHDKAKARLEEAVPTGKVLYSLTIPLGSWREILSVGSVVDVLSQWESEKHGWSVDVLLPRAKIVSIDVGNASLEKPDTISFYVPQEQVAALAQANRNGHLSLALRNRKEGEGR
jgi:Flp pilus assembly protein CpaB